MLRRALGRQGLEVSALGLGCMGMADVYGPVDPREALATMHQAVDQGVTLFDSAEVYGPFTGEEFLAQALKAVRNRVSVVTKVGYRLRESGQGLGRIAGVDGRPDHLRLAAHGSLRRLGNRPIDVLLLHRVDPAVPIEDSIGALARLVEVGDVRYIGLCEASASTIRRAHAVHPLSLLQTEYSLWSREAAERVLPTCRDLGIGFMAYSPLGRGFLTGKLRHAEELREGDVRRGMPRFQAEAIAENWERFGKVVQAQAQRLAITAAQLSLAWLLARGPDIVPIPGASRRSHLAENVEATRLRLDTDVLNALDAALPSDQTIVGQRYGELQMRMLES